MVFQKISPEHQAPQVFRSKQPFVRLHVYNQQFLLHSMAYHPFTVNKKYICDILYLFIFIQISNTRNRCFLSNLFTYRCFLPECHNPWHFLFCDFNFTSSIRCLKMVLQMFKTKSNRSFVKFLIYTLLLLKVHEIVYLLDSSDAKLGKSFWILLYSFPWRCLIIIRAAS